jgi:hypothetical protein
MNRGRRGGTVLDDNVYGFELQEWYLRNNGAPWGPVDLDDLRSLVAAGHANSSSFVRREGDSAWIRLDSVLLDIDEITLATSSDAQFSEPALHVFRVRRWAIAIESAFWPVLGYAVASLPYPPVDMFMLSAIAVGGAIGGALGAEFQRVEVTASSVRAKVGIGRVVTIALDDIDRTRFGDEGLLARLFGLRTIRSRSGTKIAVNRRALSDEEYRRLMGVLRVDTQ